MILEKKSSSTNRIGLKPWIIWGSAALFFFYEYLQRVAPGVMVPDLMRAFRIEGAAVGELGAFYYYAYAAGREVNPSAAAGISSGLINTLLIGMGAVSQALVGWLLEQHWTGTMKGNEPIYTAGDFRFAMNILIVLLAMGIVSSFLIRETHCRQRAEPRP